MNNQKDNDAKATRVRSVYYAHCIAIYGTPQEKRDLDTLAALGFEIVNPNSPECAEGYQKMKSETGNGMLYFDKFADECDAVAFRALPDGSIPAGVAHEVLKFIGKKKPVIELPTGVRRRTLAVEHTREYLEECGHR